MDELHGRFRRLDRITAPNLWGEAVGRAAEMPMARRWTLSPTMGLIAAGLLLAAFAGTMAVGAWLEDQRTPKAEITSFENGMMVTIDGCHGMVGIDPVSFERQTLVANPDGCGAVEVFTMPVTWSRDGSRLAYWGEPISESRLDGSLWLYEAASGATRQLESCQVADCGTSQVDLSPDGSLLAYTTYANAGSGVATLSVRALDSDALLSVSLSGYPDRPVFSPDGHWVAFSQLGGRSGVYLVDVSRFDEGVMSDPILIHGIVQASELAWSPDGAWIVMTQTGGLGDLDRGGRPAFNQQVNLSGQGIVIVSANGTQSRVLAALPEGSSERWASPRWSADSQTVAYITAPVVAEADHRIFELWTVPIEDHEPTRIYETDCCADYPGPITWSPDGAWIAFGVDKENRPDESGTFLIRPDGSGLRRLSPDVLDVVWQPIPKD